MATTVESFADVMKEVWSSQKLINQAYGYMLEYKSSEQIAWEDAVRWIAQKHAPAKPEEPVVFSWDWPSKKVSQSPQTLGFGDLEDDYGDEWDD